MVGIGRLRRIARRRKRTLLAAALCSASLITGHVLLGEDEPPASPPATASLLSQYLDAKNELVTAPADNPARPESPNTTPPASRRLKPVVMATENPAEPPPTGAAAEPIEIRPLIRSEERRVGK